MTSPIERFKDAYYNWRYNPFTAVDMAVDASEDGLIIPAGSPFIVQLLEVPRWNDPTTVLVRCYGVDTFVDVTSASGQKVLSVDDTTGFSPGDNIIVNRGGAREEEKIVDTVQAGVSLTVTVNLEYEHTSGQADIVEKFITFAETAGAPAQSQFRVDYPPDNGGEGTGLVEFNTNDANKEVRINYKATGSPALAETLDTKISYPAGIPDDNQIVGFSSGVPYWLRLPHSNLAGISVDQHHPQSHTLASHSSKAHSELASVSANQHHPQSHTLASHSSKAHSELTSVSASQHHNQVHALGSHSDFGNYLNQAVRTGDSPTFEIVNAMNKVRLWDTGRDHYVSLKVDENFTANQQLSIIMNNAYRAITFSGNPTLADWFNQNVKSSASPTFSNVNLTGDGKLEAGADLSLEAGDYVKSASTAAITSGQAASMIVSPTAGLFSRSTSARRYKRNIEELELDLAGIHRLRPVSFDTIHKNDYIKKRIPHPDFGKRYVGLIAEEVEKIYPDLIIYNDRKKAEDYDTKMLSTLMLAEIQRLEKRIRKLEA